MVKGTLPDGWDFVGLNTICDFSQGIQVPTEKQFTEKLDGMIRFLRIVDFTQGNQELRYIEYPGIKFEVTKEDVSMVRYGAAGFVCRGLNGVIANNLFRVIPKSDEVMKAYLYYYLQSPLVQNIIKSNTKGVTMPAVSFSLLNNLKFPLCSKSEQIRIVTKIEELLSDLDAGVAALERVRAGLKRYKASVLKAACEGKLLQQNSDDVPANEILIKVLAERKTKKPLTALPDNLSILPAGWCWATTEQLADDSKYALKAGPFGSSLKKEFYTPKGYKIYGQEQVISGDPHYGDYYIDDERYEQLKSNAIKPGDILISLVGTIGKVLILPENIEPGIINPRLVKLSLDKRLIESKYFKIYMESEFAKHYFSTVSHGETMQILNLGILKLLPIPLPPLDEQRRIVAEVERRLSVVGEVESAVEVGLVRAGRLRQSVLRSAFEGRL